MLMTAWQVLPAEILTQAVPGNLRRADTFVKYLAKLVSHLKSRLAVDEVGMRACMCMCISSRASLSTR